MNRTEERDLALWADWAASHGLPPAPASRESLEAYRAELPAKESTLAGRLRAVKHLHEREGLAWPLPPAGPGRRRPGRTGDGYADLAQALRQLPIARCPAGLRGRRDAFLLVLVGALGLSRRQALAVTAADLDLEGWRIRLPPDGTGAVRFAALPFAQEERVCGRCVAARWAQVVGDALLGFRHTVRETLDPQTALAGGHDCARPPTARLGHVEGLLPGIDRHGWVTSATMTPRAATAVLARAWRLTGREEAPFEPFRPTGRFAQATGDELAAAEDDLDARAAAVLEATRRLLAEFD